jgi:hypothetical protein
MKPFGPSGATANVAANTGSQRVAFTANADPKQVRVHNTGVVTAFIEFGDGTVTASLTTSMALEPGGKEVFSVSGLQTNMAVILASGTATVYATPGKGL